MKVGLRRRFDDRAYQVREDLSKDLVGKVLGNPFLVEPPFFKSPFVEGSRVSARWDKSFPAEDKIEDLQPVASLISVEGKKTVVVSRQISDCGKVKLKELLRD